MDDNPDGYVSVNEAARRMGRSIEQVRRYLREGRLQGRRIGNQWFIEAAAVEAFRPARVTTPREARKPAGEGPLPAAHAASGPSESGARDEAERAAEARAKAAEERAADAEARAAEAEAVAAKARSAAEATEARAAAEEEARAAAEAAAEADRAAAEARTKEPLISEELWTELDGLRDEVRKQGGELDIVEMLRQAREQA